MVKHLELNSSWCKGCNICVAFCPRKVLALLNGEAFIQNPEKCVKCGICESLCPDFAIYLAEEGGSND